MDSAAWGVPVATALEDRQITKNSRSFGNLRGAVGRKYLQRCLDRHLRPPQDYHCAIRWVAELD